jgi:hypothetical protein
MSDTPMDLFVGLSAVLTGIDKSKLAPDLDPINIKKTYFDYAQGKAGNTFQNLLNIYQQNQSQPPAQIGDIILNQSGDDICYLARAVMLMWYLGSWYDPAVLKKYNGPQPPTDPVPAFAVISSAAYTQGWAWSVAQAHPMGYSNFQYGYWSKLPPSLQDFIGGGS